MSTTRKIAHNTSVQIVGKVVSTVLGLLAIGMMTRYLGTEQFGWYITAITFLQFVGILIDFGLIPVSAQMLGEGKYEERTLLQNLLGFRLVTAVFFFVLAPIVALFFPYPPIVKIAIAMSAISFVAIAINQILMGFFQKQLTMHIHAIAENVGRVVLVVGLYLVMTLEEGFLWVMMMTVLSSIAFTLALLWGARKQTTLGVRFDTAIWKAISIKMWPVATAVMFNVIYLKGDTIVLSLFGTQSDVGLYGAAYRVIDILSQLAMMVMGVMLPLIAATWATQNTQELRQKVQQGFDAMMLFAVPITIGIYVLATPIISLVASDAFAGAGVPLTLLALSIFAVYIGAVFGHIAVAIDRQKETLPIYISNAIIATIAYLIVIPRYGMIGAAILTVITEVYTAILLYIKIRGYLPFRLQGRVFIKILLAGTIMGWSIYFLIDSMHVILVSAIGAIIYGILILALRAISKETLTEIMRIERKI